jgi:P-type Cu+ transporter
MSSIQWGLLTRYLFSGAVKKLNDWLSGLPVSSQTPISTSNAISTLRYTPSSNFTIRTICASVPQPFKATVYDRPSLYSRSREIQTREAKSRVRQFLISFVFAIPTFTFGIIGMIALPKSNPFRQWCDGPSWWGGASRAVILLFVFATLTMFGVTRYVAFVHILLYH